MSDNILDFGGKFHVIADQTNSHLPIYKGVLEKVHYGMIIPSEPYRIRCDGSLGGMEMGKANVPPIMPRGAQTNEEYSK
jgi:hypothetical protein